MSIDAAFVSFPLLNADRLNLHEIQSTDEEAFFSLNQFVLVLAKMREVQCQ